MFGSALKLDGVQAFLNLLDEYTVMPSYGAEFGAKVYKIAEDNQGNRLTFMKITGGSLKVREVLQRKKYQCRKGKQNKNLFRREIHSR